MTSSKKGGSIRRVAQVDRDGAQFFRRANLLAADPRVKYIFLHAAEEYDRALAALGKHAGSAKSKAKVPAIFPFDRYDRIDCYVCGYEARVDDLPDSCPSCGSPRYTFERELSQEAAWDLVAKTTRKAVAFAKKEGSAAKGGAGEALAAAAGIRKALLDEATAEKARAGG